MASWNTPIITNSGIELLNKTIDKQSITITDIKISSQKLVGNLQETKSITDIKKTITPSSISVEDNQVKIRAILTNENNRSDYDLETIGIYANNVLFALITAKDSDRIPTDNGSGTVTIDFEFFININRKANFSILHNSSALLTLRDLNTIVDDSLSQKANSKDVITDLKINNSEITYIKGGNKTTLRMPEVIEAQDSVSGKISKNGIREIVNTLVTDDRIKGLADTKVKEFGIGSNAVESKNVDDNLANGIYTLSVNNHNSMVVNSQYGDQDGIQLLVSKEDKPQIKVRNKDNGKWTEWANVHTSLNLTKASLEDLWEGV